ncbi:MAG: SusD/RagB family nutrient-binding outer membrane lipoprotein [Flavobacteriaceae bacterium]|nr:MAG: SusD/RagB family nutrient-binding outer membrane lipoprotein [Flavobacteriaceae bacterium]
MKKIFLLAFIILGTISCETDFSDWNKDEKNATKVPASTLFSNGQRNLVRTMKMQNVNVNIFNFFAQYWTATTYPDEANYDIVGRDVPGGFWNRMYRDVLNDLQEAQLVLKVEKETIATSLIPVNINKQAITTILQVYTYHVLVDVFGDIPYTEALDITNSSPKYDDDTAIYADLFTKLDAAIANLDSDFDSFGGADFIYQGDVKQWMKFANSLKLRMAMRTKDSEKVSQAVAGGVFTSNSDNAAFMFTTSDPYSNPLWENLVQSNRNDLVVSDSFVNLITPLNDPRTSAYMADNKTPYVGGPYGENNSYNSYTHLGAIFHVADFEGVILDYAEVEFLLAEAAALTIGGVSDASSHYESGITASINYWAPTADAAAYVASQPFDAANWKKSIGTQKYIALYSRGFEGWTSWRQFGVPTLEAPKDAHKDAEGMVPVRYTYPADEAQRNGTNYEAASAAIGGDKLSTRVFWNNN